MPRLQFNDFSGGLWIPAETGSTNQQPGFAIPKNGLLQADNVEPLPSGALRGRRGFAKRNATAIRESEPIVAMWRHYGRQGQGEVTKRTPIWNDRAGVGTEAWLAPTYAGSADGNPAHVALSAPGALQSHYMDGSQWALSVPDNATILGIQVDILRCASAGGDGAVRDTVVSLSKATGVPIGDNKAETETNWPIGSYEWISYGGPSDLWGTSWTPSELNGEFTFQVLIAVESTVGTETAQIDCVRVTVWYSTTRDQRRFLVFINHADMRVRDIYVEGSAGEFSYLSNIATQAYRPRFVYWPARNKTFIFTGGNNLISYNGVIITGVTAMTEDDVVLKPRSGPFAALFNERLWATDPAELNFSVYASETTLNGAEEKWYPNKQISVSDREGGTITGLVAYRDVLYILKDTCIWAFVGDIDAPTQLGQVSERGCVAPNTVQVTPFGIIYLAQDGLYLFSPDGEVELSRAIRPLFAGRTTQTTYRTAVGIYHPRRGCYYLRLSPTSDECYVLYRLGEGDKTSLAWARIPTFPMYSACRPSRCTRRVAGRGRRTKGSCSSATVTGSSARQTKV
jgi:hypothetical protein